MRLPDNLPALLREAGLQVTEVKGWQDRGRPGAFAPVGVLNHHTAASARGWTLVKMLAYCVWMAVTGRSDLPAPLVQLALAPTGRVFILAAGRANHAGSARPSGSVSGGDGNERYVGIEWMLSGTEAIPPAMLEAGVLLNAVLTHEVLNTSVNTISCHYNTSVTGKWDIGDPNGVAYNGHKVFDVPRFRKSVEVARAALYTPKPTQPAPGAPVNKPKRNLVGVAWNMKVGRKSAAVRSGLTDLIKSANKPKFVVLNEARGYRLLIRAVALLLGYKVYQPTGKAPKGVKAEAGSTALLVRKNVPVKDSGVLRMTKRWSWFPGANRTGKEQVHEGRVFPWVVIPLDGEDTLVVAVHMPVDKHNPDKRDAWDETLAVLEALIKASALNGVTAYLLLGDWNDRYTSTDKRSPRALAERTGGTLRRVKGAWIDYALSKGHKARVEDDEARGSDHKAKRLYIEKD